MVDYLGALIKTLERLNDDITFCLFSAQGADQSERNPVRFARAKGRAERLLFESGLQTKCAFRPGYIKPGRKNPPPMGLTYWLADRAYKVLPLIGIDAPDLAKVMVDVGLHGNPKQILENRDLRRLARA